MIRYDDKKCYDTKFCGDDCFLIYVNACVIRNEQLHSTPSIVYHP